LKLEIIVTSFWRRIFGGIIVMTSLKWRYNIFKVWLRRN